MHTVAVVITTFDRSQRGKRNYLGDTLQHLERSGLWASRTPWTLTLVDGGSPPGYPACEVRGDLLDDPLVRIVRPPAGQVLTCNENAAAAWRIAGATGAPWVLVLEDDIDVCADFLDETQCWLEQHARPDRHLYPLGCPHRDVEAVAAAGGTAWEYPIGHYWGSQGTAARHADAVSLGAYLTAHPRHASGSTYSHDWVMADWAREQWPEIAHFLTPAPGLVQHVGRESYVAVDRLKVSKDAIIFFDYPSWRGRGEGD
jgi:hypothetical protein